LLDALRELGDSGTPDEVVERIAKNLQLPETVLSETLASGESRYRNQVQWARYYLVKEGLVGASRRGIWTLTEPGRQTHLTSTQSREIFLRVVRDYQEQRKARGNTDQKTALLSETPTAGTDFTGTLEQLKEIVAPEGTSIDPADSNTTYKERLLTVIRSLSPSGFERLTQRILRESGFSHVEVTGKSGDGGIDGSGTLSLNKLISIRALFQCKKYQGSVSASHVRDFRGAMQGRADYGLIITTGYFTADAGREASRDGVSTIELIDGVKLVALLENLQLGVRPVQTFEVDEAFFDSFRSDGDQPNRQ
jgi:restriction system protein